MLTIISFILTLLGSVNWLMIGLLQYDFIAGIFGFQASILSRIVYILIGASSAILVFKLIKGKGTLFVISKRNKKDIVNKIENVKQRAAANSNVESGEDVFKDDVENNGDEKISHGLFDEHFDDRG